MAHGRHGWDTDLNGFLSDEIRLRQISFSRFALGCKALTQSTKTLEGFAEGKSKNPFKSVSNPCLPCAIVSHAIYHNKEIMIRIHKEGKLLIAILTLIVIVLSAVVHFVYPAAFWPVLVALLLLWVTIVQFFRNPRREIVVPDNQLIYAPADGKVCVIEEVTEGEYFNDRRKQVSIFMSPVNVHVNRNPVSGTVNYFRYHPGKYLVAWHPKSSEENERTTIVYGFGEAEILMRQIAGALAKRIRTYVNEGDKVAQGDDMGFIKFGSRVDLYLPLDAEIMVQMDQKVKGNKTVIAKLK